MIFMNSTNYISTTLLQADGATLIHGLRIIASDNFALSDAASRQLGTRHRAAMELQSRWKIVSVYCI